MELYNIDVTLYSSRYFPRFVTWVEGLAFGGLEENWRIGGIYGEMENYTCLWMFFWSMLELVGKNGTACALVEKDGTNARVRIY